MKTGSEDSLSKCLAEKRDVVVVRGRYTVRIFYFKVENNGIIFTC